VQHELAEVVVPGAEPRQDVCASAAQAAPEGAIVTRDPGEAPGAGPYRPDQDAAGQDFLEDLPGRRHVRVQRGRPAAPDPAKAFDLLLLVAEVALVALQVSDPGLGLTPLLLGGLELGYQGVHVVAHGDCLGQLRLGGGELRDCQEEVLALRTPGRDLLGVGGLVAEVLLELSVREGDLQRVDHGPIQLGHRDPGLVGAERLALLAVAGADVGRDLLPPPRRGDQRRAAERLPARRVGVGPAGQQAREQVAVHDRLRVSDHPA
jgi:hypothetical protein